MHAGQSCGHYNNYLLVFLFREDILDLSVADESVQVIEEERNDNLIVFQWNATTRISMPAIRSSFFKSFCQ
jgi:hypothetical protein